MIRNAIISVIGLSVGASAASAAIYSDGSVFFEDFTSPSNALNSATWDDISNDGGSTLTVSGGLMSITTPSSAADRSIVTDQSTAFNLGAITEPAYEARFMVAANDVLDNASSRNARVFVGIDTNFNNFIFAVGIRNGSTASTFDLVEDGNYGAPLLTGLNREQYYVATVVYNSGTTGYDLYLDGNPVGTLVTIDNTLGRPTRIYTGDNNGGTQYQGFTIDYFKVGAVAVPEPTGASILLLGTAGAVLRRRRRRHNA